MSSRLIACPSCARLYRNTDDRCPHCDTRAGRGVTARAAWVPAIVMGLTLAGCGGDDSDSGSGSTLQTSETMSATQGTQSVTDSSPTSDDSATSTSAGPASDSNMPTTAQPPYGVPDTGSTAVPTSDDGTTGDSGTTGEDDTSTSTGIEPPYGVGAT